MKVLFDTCVIIDSLQNREPFAEVSNKLLLAVARGEIEGYITAKSITDIFYLTHRITHDNEKTKDITAKLLSLYKLLDTKGIDCERALVSDISDFEDAVMVQTAKRTEMDLIVTRNEKDFNKSDVKINNPQELVKSLKL